MFKKTIVRITVSFFLMLLSFSAFSLPDYWVDVRSVKEFNSSHIAAAINIPYKKIADQISSVTTDKEAVIYLYCKSGGRAGVAEKTLKEMGYINVTNIGGIKDARAVEQQ